MSECGKSKNELAWEKLFAKHDIFNKIDRDGEFIISAVKIKEEREPRLMAKFDHSANLPPIFANNKLTILPITRGDYIISHYEAYSPFVDKKVELNQFSLPEHLQSLSVNNIPSETIAINCALASGMLSDFLEEETLYSTVSGRMGSGKFSFAINNINMKMPVRVNVNQSQIEIDAAFEGLESLALLEAKRDLADDFLVRQLYYPFRVWQTRVTKTVRPVFIVYSNSIFRLYEYRFDDPDNYNSLALVKQKNYTIEETEIQLSELIELKGRIKDFSSEPEIPFPQADAFSRLINLCELLKEHSMTREQVTAEYDFDIRQTNYYTDAGRYLGLIDKVSNKQSGVTYLLSDLGKRILGLDYKHRQLALCKCILEHKVFYDVFELWLKSGKMPTRSAIVNVMKQTVLYNINSDETFNRRASTIKHWINWIFDLIER